MLFRSVPPVLQHVGPCAATPRVVASEVLSGLAGSAGTSGGVSLTPRVLVAPRDISPVLFEEVPHVSVFSVPLGFYEVVADVFKEWCPDHLNRHSTVRL